MTAAVAARQLSFGRLIDRVESPCHLAPLAPVVGGGVTLLVTGERGHLVTALTAVVRALVDPAGRGLLGYPATRTVPVLVLSSSPNVSNGLRGLLPDTTLVEIVELNRWQKLDARFWEEVADHVTSKGIRFVVLADPTELAKVDLTDFDQARDLHEALAALPVPSLVGAGGHKTSPNAEGIENYFRNVAQPSLWLDQTAGNQAQGKPGKLHIINRHKANTVLAVRLDLATGSLWLDGEPQPVVAPQAPALSLVPGLAVTVPDAPVSRTGADALAEPVLPEGEDHPAYRVGRLTPGANPKRLSVHVMKLLSEHYPDLMDIFSMEVELRHLLAFLEKHDTDFRAGLAGPRTAVQEFDEPPY